MAKRNLNVVITGALFDPPVGPSGTDGMGRDPYRGRKAEIGAGTAAAAGIVGVVAWLWLRRR